MKNKPFRTVYRNRTSGRFVPKEQGLKDPQASDQQHVKWMTWREQQQLPEA